MEMYPREDYVDDPGRGFKFKVTNDLNFASLDQESVRKDLAMMIVLHEYPLSMVDHYGFRKFCNNMQPLFKVVSRNTIKKDIFKMYDVEKEDNEIVKQKPE
ncbi:hypothetical protein Patl1_34040 [Pistacia atlantica]|uniref:Uncharacterized protein n=1 Tax=Pistacia atlantica TaxID=434234 RepID=A0ACC0ZSQ7_9ROSI|nr:hypothetical protein Patl1_34040 [Pistacia atlantica]